MKKLWTLCPYCRSQFYVDVKPERQEKVHVQCPYCNYQYGDTVRENRIVEVKYNWELYDRIYSEYLSRKDKSKHLMVAGILLGSALALFSLGIVSMFFVDAFSLPEKGIGLAGSVFSVFVFLGVLNSLRRNSFVLSFTGTIFALLNSAVWGYLNSSGGFMIFKENLSILYTFLVLALSLSSLVIIVANKSHFSSGY